MSKSTYSSKMLSSAKKQTASDLYRGIFSPSTAHTTPLKITSTSTRLAKTYSTNILRGTREFLTRAGENMLKHNVSMEQIASNSSRRFFPSPKRDPILQSNGEENVRPGSGLRKTASSHKITIFNDPAPLFKAKKRGDFNPKFEHPEERIKPKGIRTGIETPCKSNKNDEDVFRRSKRSVDNPNWLKTNPITVGDARYVEYPRAKSVDRSISMQTQRLNDSRFLLPSERGKSPNGRVFREQKVNVFKTYDAYFTPSKTPHPFEKKVKIGSIKGVLQYESALPYRDYGITPSPTKMDPERLKGIKDEYRGMFVVRRLLTES